MSNVAGKAYGMNVLTPVPPGLTWLQRLIFMAARAFPSTLSGLLNLSLIHFARWVIIKRDQWPAGDRGKPALANDYVLFCSNFNGTWDQYIDAFSDGIPTGLDLFWYASEKFPHSIPITPFKGYIVHNQFDTNYYYNATPGSAQRDIKAALNVYAELKTLEEKHRALDAQSFAAAYNGSLAKIQNCLGSPGYAPVASIDTDNADRNRAKFVAAANAAPAATVSAKAPRAAVAPPAPSNTFDGGHCFLTILLPIKTCEVVAASGMRSSPAHMVRDALAVLPTARQSPATQSLPLDSPFARSTRTHFARMAVIDDVIFNGRPAPEGLLGERGDLTIPGPVDQLPCPYLLFSADCDARNEDDLRNYLREMWRTIGADLQPVFTNCFGYDQTATDEDGFADYMVGHRIGTTLPFNDYWPENPPLPTLSFVGLAIAGLAAFAAVFAGLFSTLHALHAINSSFGYSLKVLIVFLASASVGLYVAYGLKNYQSKKSLSSALLLLELIFADLAAFAAVFAGLIWILRALHLIGPFNWSVGYWLIMLAVFLVSALAALYVAYRMIIGRGARPFPAAPNSDLLSVLKALYLQRELIAFAVSQQGASPESLYDAFGRFLNVVRVGDIVGPSQAPGTITGKTPGNIPPPGPGPVRGTPGGAAAGNAPHPGAAPDIIAGTV